MDDVWKPREALIHQLIEKQVQRSPDAPAVLYENRSLTYSELNRKANQLAHLLTARGVVPDQKVGLCVERSLEMVIGLLGILKAGGAYVPLDPGYPADRLSFMLRDASPGVLLTQRGLKEQLPPTTAALFFLDDDWPETDPYDSSDLDPEALNLTSGNLSYVIYTSGSTGTPKGAMNEHRAVSNRIIWMQDEFGLNSTDRVLQKTPFSFDVSVWEFFWPLMSGACLVVARPHGHRDPDYLNSIIKEAEITTLHFVPSMLQLFLDQIRAADCAGIRRVFCSGEELSVALQNSFIKLLPQARLYNLYGPTEAAVDVTRWDCRTQEPGTRVPIGSPIANVQIHILNSAGGTVHSGDIGEIHIGGIGVGRGYHNRPALTAERFVADPFSHDGALRLYKTGDLGRLRTDGAIEYLGRNDDQVKIRGFRVEPGEIDAALRSAPGVKDAVTVAREGPQGLRRLIAYVVTDTSVAEASARELREYLADRLPAHMVPALFVQLAEMPLTPSGKTDRRALPEPDEPAQPLSISLPGDTTEEVLIAVWRNALKVERIGVDDNFFELGGDSLMSIEMIGVVAEALELELPFMAAFQYPTIRELAEFVNETIAENAHSSAAPA